MSADPGNPLWEVLKKDWGLNPRRTFRDEQEQALNDALQLTIGTVVNTPHGPGEIVHIDAYSSSFEPNVTELYSVRINGALEPFKAHELSLRKLPNWLTWSRLLPIANGAGLNLTWERRGHHGIIATTPTAVFTLGQYQPTGEVFFTYASLLDEDAYHTAEYSGPMTDAALRLFLIGEVASIGLVSR